MLFWHVTRHILAGRLGGDKLVLTQYIFVSSEVGKECWIVKFSCRGTIVTLFGLQFEIASPQHLAFKAKSVEKEALGTRVQLFFKKGD